jgi:hypothetical protein
VTTAAPRPPAPWWHSAVDDWTLYTDWWKHPAAAYLAGLQHGVQLERDRQWVEADAVHSEAVRRALAFIEICEAREAADRPRPVALEAAA